MTKRGTIVDINQAITLIASLSAIIFGYLAWLARNKNENEKSGAIDQKLDNIQDTLKDMMEKYEKTNEEIGKIRERLAVTEADISTIKGQLKCQKGGN